MLLFFLAVYVAARVVLTRGADEECLQVLQVHKQQPQAAGELK